MPEYDAFGREIDPDDRPAVTPSAQAEPAESSGPDRPPRPRRRRNPVAGLITFAFAALVVAAAGAVFLAADSGGGGSTLSESRDAMQRSQDDLERSQQEFEDALERSAGDPDAASPLTEEGASAAIDALRKESDEPRAVAFEAARTIAILPPSKPDGVPAVFTWALNRGSDSPNGFRSEKPEYVRLQPFAWDDVRAAVVPEVVAAAGGEDAVEQVAIQRRGGALRWTAYLKGGAEKRFDAAGKPV